MWTALGINLSCLLPVPRCFRLHTDTFDLVWSTRHTHTAQRPLHVAVLEGKHIQVEVAPDAAALHEETTYSVLVRSDAPVLLTHRHPSLFAHLNTTDSGRIAHGTINFGSQVGYSDITVLVGGAVACTFRVEVYPSKIDYQWDYVALRDAVGNLQADLALGYMQRTYQLGHATPSSARGLLGWLFMLRALADDLTAAIQHIARQPHQRAIPVTRPIFTEHLRAHDVQIMLPALLRTTNRAMQRRPHLLGTRRTYTHDLWEHAWIQDHLSAYVDRLDAIQRALSIGSTSREHEANTELTKLKNRFAALSSALPTEASTIHASYPQHSPLFEHAAGYREVYRICMLLQQMLDLHGGAIPFEVKDIHQLYEYWCYLTVAQALADHLNLKMPLYELVALRNDRLPMRLWHGRHQTLEVDVGERGTLTLTYNPRYSGPAYLVPQQPDIVLTLHAPEKPALRFILDAKYRLDTSRGYIRRYGAPGPPRDALNDLHRYRDALQEYDGAHASVVHAVVIFPYHDSAEHDFSSGRLWNSIRHDGIGALPMLPNNTGYLERWLAHVLEQYV
ncbi:MAG: hypothetical protein RhofKO_03100 [Rhodothermales bacterium]